MGIVINKDGKPVAALVDAELFARIRRMRERFDALAGRIGQAYAELPADDGMAEIDAAVAAALMPGLRVVLDTNVLVSGLAYPGSVPGRIVDAWRQGGLDVVLSRCILDELARVLPRHARIRMTAAEIRDLADSFMFLADVVEPAGVPDASLRDPADQTVLLTLLASKADCLITGDKDWLALAGRYPVVTPADFWARHG